MNKFTFTRYKGIIVARIAKEELEETKGLSFASLRNTDTAPTVNVLYDRGRKESY